MFCFGFRPTGGERAQRAMGQGNGLGNVGDVLGGFGVLWRFMGEERGAFEE